MKRASQDIKNRFIKELEVIQAAKGVLNALLTLRNWAFFPEKERGAKNRSRLAHSYLGGVLNYLEHHLNGDAEMGHFLKWCRKRTRKVFQWEFQEGKLRSPPKSALPIYKDEAASYIRHFLQRTDNPKSSLGQHFAEMVIYLSLSLACGRQQSNYFAPADILRITKDNLTEVSLAAKIDHFDAPQDVREKSKSSNKAHHAVQLGVSPDFLLDSKLWPECLPMPPSQSMRPPCRAIRIRGRTVLIGQSVAHAIEIMGKFTITYKNIENRLNEAYESIGLFQSSGGIAPRCFLCQPHHWPSVDVRKNWEKCKV